MASNDIYEGPANVILDSSLLAEATRVTLKYTSGNSTQKTMKKGYAGYARGAGETSAQVENAVPKVGLEQEFVEKCVAGAKCRIEYVSAGKRYQIEGRVDDVESTNGVDEAASFSFTFNGGKPTIT